MIWQNLSAEERSGVAAIRERLGDKISTDLDTDFNLARWWRGYHGDIERIASAMPSYIESRRAAGFEETNHVARYFELPSIKPYLPFIACSRLYDSAYSDNLGAFLFVEKAWSQPKEFVKVMKTSDYVLHCFGYSEKLLQLILRKEQQTKRPVQIITIFDMGEVNLSDYVNIMSPHLKLWKIRSDLWQDWYPEIIQKIIVVNPPRLVGMFWGLAKTFLNERNRAVLHLESSHDDIQKHLDPHMIPVAYGGKLQDSNPIVDESCCSKRKRITADDYYQSGRNFGLFSSRPKSVHTDLHATVTIRVPVTIRKGQRLLWEFRSNGEIEFCIFFDESLMVYPKLRLVTSKVPEEGLIDADQDGKFTFHFHNTSHYFQAKLDYIISVV